MAYFPLFIDIKEKKCLVVGGGKVALRKTETLLRYQAAVYVVGETVCEEIRALLPPGQIREGEPEPADLEGAVLAVAATGSREVNRRLARYCRSRNIPVNVADAPEECSFFFPAVIKKGDISIGVNTGGKSPVVSGRIRRELEQAVPDYYGEIAAQLGELREYVQTRFREENVRREILKRTAAEAFSHERILSHNEINTIIGQVIRHDTIS